MLRQTADILTQVLRTLTGELQWVVEAKVITELVTAMHLVCGRGDTRMLSRKLDVQVQLS